MTLPHGVGLAIPERPTRVRAASARSKSGHGTVARGKGNEAAYLGAKRSSATTRPSMFSLTPIAPDGHRGWAIAADGLTADAHRANSLCFLPPRDHATHRLEDMCVCIPPRRRAKPGLGLAIIAHAPPMATPTTTPRPLQPPCHPQSSSSLQLGDAARQRIRFSQGCCLHVTTRHHIPTATSPLNTTRSQTRPRPPRPLQAILTSYLNAGMPCSHPPAA